MIQSQLNNEIISFVHYYVEDMWEHNAVVIPTFFWHNYGVVTEKTFPYLEIQMTWV